MTNGVKMKRLLLAAALVAASVSAWADQTIDQIGSAAALDGTELIPVFQVNNPALSTTLPALSTFFASTTQSFTNKTVDCGGTGNVCTVRIAFDVSGLGTGVATWLGTPSSANLAAALTDGVGTGSAVFAIGPTISAAPSFGLRDTSASFDVTLGATSSVALTTGRAVTFDVVNGARNFKFGANLTIATDPGAVTGALKSDGSGTFAQAACSDLSGGCGAGGTISYALTYPPGINPNNMPIANFNSARTVTAIRCNPEVAAGGTATISVVKAASGTALSAGTLLHSGSCNANGTVATDQNLTLVGGATDELAAGDRIGITTTGTTVWTSSGIATGVVTVFVQ